MSRWETGIGWKLWTLSRYPFSENLALLIQAKLVLRNLSVVFEFNISKKANYQIEIYHYYPNYFQGITTVS